ncbi:hypothetical protein IJT93_05125 [bacterium]|nr:hypothetical protein [bacterium]
MNKYFIGLLAASLLFGSAAAASAANYEFYVRNRPFTGTASISGKSVEASLSDLLQALGYSWSVQDHKIYVYNQKGKGPSFVDSGVYTIEFEGHSANITLNARGGRSMVDVASLAKALDLKYQVSDNLNTIDLLAPMSKSKADALAASYKKAASYGKSGEEDGKEGGKDTKKASKYKLNADGKMEAKFSCPAPGSLEAAGATDSKVVINSVDWFINDMGSFSIPTELHLNSVSLTNGGEPVENVKVKVDVVYYDGFSAYSWTKDYPAFAAGQSETFIPDPAIWFNNNRTPVTLSVTVTHDPPKEKEEVQKKKKNKITADVDDMRIGQTDSKVGGIYRAKEEADEADEAEEGGEAEGAQETETK